MPCGFKSPPFCLQTAGKRVAYVAWQIPVTGKELDVRLPKIKELSKTSICTFTKRSKYCDYSYDMLLRRHSAYI